MENPENQINWGNTNNQNPSPEPLQWESNVEKPNIEDKTPQEGWGVEFNKEESLTKLDQSINKGILDENNKEFVIKYIQNCVELSLLETGYLFCIKCKDGFSLSLNKYKCS